MGVPIEKPVLIVGGGIGGLVLAHALKNKSIPCRIFERDPALDHRPQGYRFHLQPNGADALYACLDAETIKAFDLASPYSRGPEDGMAYNPRTGEEDLEMLKLAPKYKPGQKPLNVDRGSLRRVLSEGVPVEFGKRFDSYHVTADGVTVIFHDGTTAEGSLLVGADGVRSHVRPALLPEYTLLDTEGRWIWGKSDLTPELRSKLPPILVNGIIGANDRTDNGPPVTLLAESITFDRSPSNPRAHLHPPDYIYWVLQFAKRTVQVDDAQFFALDSAGAAQHAQDLTTDWTPELRAIFAHTTPGSAAAQAVTAGDPSVPEYDGQGRVTLLGDAIHSMPPTAGMGATSAIMDAKWLAEALEENGVSRESLAVYEEKMRKNGAEAIASSEPRSMKMFGAPVLAEMKRIRP